MATRPLLAVRYPGLGARAELLGGPGGDLPDPIGGDGEVYRACAALIAAHVERLVSEWTRP